MRSASSGLPSLGEFGLDRAARLLQLPGALPYAQIQVVVCLVHPTVGLDLLYPAEAHLAYHLGELGEIFKNGRQPCLVDNGNSCRGLHVGGLIEPELVGLSLEEGKVRRLEKKLTGEKVHKVFSVDFDGGCRIDQSILAPVDGVPSACLDLTGDAHAALDAPSPRLGIDAMEAVTYVLPSGTREDRAVEAYNKGGNARCAMKEFREALDAGDIDKLGE